MRTFTELTQKVNALRKQHGFILTILFALFLPINAGAYDLWQEKEITENLLSLIDKNKHLWLETSNNRKVFSLYEKNVSQSIKGGIILLPNINAHVDWPTLIRPLRARLILNGWQVLTIQPPVSSNNQDSVFFQELPEEIAMRINAAIDYYSSKNIHNIALVAHGHAANLAALYLSENNNQSDRISAFAGISLRHYALYFDWPDTNRNLELIKIPFLDIHGRLTNTLIKKAANQRRLSAHLSGSITQQTSRANLTAKVAELAFNKTGNLAYRQITLHNSDYDLHYSDHEAVKKIRAWLATYAVQ